MHPFVVLIERHMHKNYKKLFINPGLKEFPAGLFDRIIIAIKREQELRHTKRLLFEFLSLLVISLIVTPFSGMILVSQIKNSGIFYFISTAISNSGIFFTLWQDFSLAILESLPIGGIIMFLVSLIISVFTLRLFLHRKKLLLGYLMQNFA
jgi:hypothetical protein